MWSSICALRGHRQGARQGRFAPCLDCGALIDPPRYRVKAWRFPNEDGGVRPVPFFHRSVPWPSMSYRCRSFTVDGRPVVRSMAAILADQGGTQ